MFVLYVMILLDYTIEMTVYMLYQTFQLVYTIAERKEEMEESRREEKQRPMPRGSFSRALAALVMCCKSAKPYHNKSFYVGSVFELDVVQSSGLVWARLGGSSSSQILREAVFVLQALQF